MINQVAGKDWYGNEYRMCPNGLFCSNLRFNPTSYRKCENWGGNLSCARFLRFTQVDGTEEDIE